MSDQSFNSYSTAGSKLRILFLCLLIGLTTGAGSCNSETLFKSNFDANAVNQQPAQSQAVGTVAVEGDVKVVPLPDSPSIKGVRFDLSASLDAALQCNLKPHPAAGIYVFTTALYVPSNSGGTVTIAFLREGGIGSPATELPATELKAAAGGGQRLLHLDFIGDRVRIDDDDSSFFGNFSRDQVFTVQVTLKLTSSPNAHIVLSGAGASGEANRNLGTHPVALDFGAVRIQTVRTADVQMFYAANIVVTRK